MSLRRTTFPEAIAGAERELRAGERALARGRFGTAQAAATMAHRYLRVAAHRIKSKGGMPRLPADLVGRMYADYQAGASLAALGRKYGRDRRSIREVFERRHLAVRPPPMKLSPRLPNGQVAPYVPLTAAELDALIRRQSKLRVPPELKLEWRHWSLERRGQFIARLRAHVKSPKDRPDTPFSANVEPFDYASPRAHEIMRRANAGRDSRTATVKIDIVSQGVIWRDQLWFWSHKIGYQRGPWTPSAGRPSLHRVIWEESTGFPVPPGCVVRHADGNRNNLAPENLVLATRDNVCRETQARVLQRRSRELTSILLNRAQSANHENTRQLQTLRLRHR